MRDMKKMSGKNNVRFKKICKLALTIFHKSYIFSFIHQKRFYGNKNLNFPAKIYETRKKC